MNKAMEMLRSRAQDMYDMIVGEENITLEIDEIALIPSGSTLEKPQREPIVANCSAPVLNAEWSKSMNETSNLYIDLCFDQLNILPKLEGKVWIYNVSQQNYELSNSLIRRCKVPACPEGDDYVVVTSIPLVIAHPKHLLDDNTTDYFLMDGRRVAMDLINPSNLSIDQDKDCDWLSHMAVGNDFSKRGVFFSTHNPPLKKELKAAHKRLKVYYTNIIERANIVRISSAAATLGLPPWELTAAVDYVEGRLTTK